jgi:hypothetical protein
MIQAGNRDYDRQSVIDVLEELVKEFGAKGSEWENRTLESYFEALQAWLHDCAGYQRNSFLRATYLRRSGRCFAMLYALLGITSDLGGWRLRRTKAASAHAFQLCKEPEISLHGYQEGSSSVDCAAAVLPGSRRSSSIQLRPARHRYGTFSAVARCVGKRVDARRSCGRSRRRLLRTA